MALKSVNNTSVFSPVKKKSISLAHFLICLSASSSSSPTPWSRSWNGVFVSACVCVCATLCVYVCVRVCPTVTKWFDRPCHMVDKWWMGARQHTIKPVNLLGNVSSHLPPDGWPVNTQTNRGSRLKHTHINLPHLHFTLTTFSLPAPQAKHGPLTFSPH